MLLECGTPNVGIQVNGLSARACSTTNLLERHQHDSARKPRLPEPVGSSAA